MKVTMEKNGNKPAAKHSNLLLTKEKGLGVFDLDLVVLPLSVDSVILEHVGLQEQNHSKEPYNRKKTFGVSTLSTH